MSPKTLRFLLSLTNPKMQCHGSVTAAPLSRTRALQVGTPVTTSQWFLCGGWQDTGQDLHLPGTHSALGTQQGQKRHKASPCPGSPDCYPLLCKTPNRDRTVLLSRGSPLPQRGTPAAGHWAWPSGLCHGSRWSLLQWLCLLVARQSESRDPAISPLSIPRTFVKR